MTDEQAEQVITREQATAMVGKHVLALLEDVIAAHEAVLADPGRSDTAKGNARLVIASAQGIGAPLYQVVKHFERPRILRPERSIRIVR